MFHLSSNLFRATVAPVVVAAFVGCSQVERGRVPPDPPSTAAPTQTEPSVARLEDDGALTLHVKIHEDWVRPYPAGRWRLLGPQKARRIAFSFSHLLIRHAEVTPGVVPFKMPWWRGALPLPQRSRSEALSLAQSLMRQAKRHTGTFGDLASEYSEDIATARTGGYAGVVPFDDLATYAPEVLDALTAIEIGKVSEVVESMYGFHVLVRRPPPQRERVSGVHIVIGHDRAPLLHMSRPRGPIPQRSKEQAEALARDVYQMAIREGADFAALTQRYSEHSDATRGGDFGEWSTWEPSPGGIALVLQKLQIGEIAPPFDSPMGFHVVRRTAPRKRQQLNFTGMEISSRGTESVSLTPRQLAAQLNRELMEHPERLQDIQRRYCCEVNGAWIEGQGDPLFAAEVEGLRIGQITPEPIWMPHSKSFLILKRLAPSPTRDELPLSQFDLPEGFAPDVEYLVGDWLTADQVRNALEQVAQALPTVVDMEPARAEQLRRVHELAQRLTPDVEDNSERRAIYRALRDQVATLLDNREEQLYERLLGAQVEAAVLDSEELARQHSSLAAK